MTLAGLNGVWSALESEDTARESEYRVQMTDTQTPEFLGIFAPYRLALSQESVATQSGNGRAMA